MFGSGYICPCCGSSHWVKKISLPSYLFSRSADIIVCSVCALGATWPPPTSDYDYYQQNQQYVDSFSEKSALFYQFAEKMLDNLQGVVNMSGKRLLDIGCGLGFLVEAAARHGIISEGIEANSNLVSRSISRGLNVSCSTIENLKKDGRKYDFIVFSSVLEHLVHPDIIIQSCKDLLNEGGIIIASQAAYDGLLPNVFPWGWYGWQPKEHYWHFSLRSFFHLAEKSGLRVISYSKDSLYHPYFAHGGLKVLIGRNIAAVIARFGKIINKGDSFIILFEIASGSQIAFTQAT